MVEQAFINKKLTEAAKEKDLILEKGCYIYFQH